MQTRPNDKDLFTQLEEFSKAFTFDRFNVYHQYGKADFKKSIDDAANLIDKLIAANAEMDAPLEALCAQVSRKVGIYYAFCENDHVKAAKYICNHRTVHELSESVLKKNAEISAQGSTENSSKKEVELADNYTLILYGQTHDGVEHAQLLHYLEAQLQDYDRLEKSEAHRAYRNEIALSKALILDCLAVKYLQIALPTIADNEKSLKYINAAIAIQKKHTASNPLSIVELAYSYYLLSIHLMKQFDITGAANQADFAITLFAELQKSTGHFNLKEFEPRQHHASLLRDLNHLQDSKEHLIKIIADQIQFYATNSHLSVIKSYQLLGQIDKPCHELAQAELKKITKKQKITKRIEALKRLPTYDWCHYQTAKDFLDNIIKIEELIGKLHDDIDFLDPQQKTFLAQEYYILGTYYSNVKSQFHKAGEIFSAAIAFTPPGFDAISLQLQMAYQTQFTLSKVKRDKHLSKAIELTSEQRELVDETTQRCHEILIACQRVCNDPNHQTEPEKLSKILLFSHYIAAIMELQLAEIDIANQQQVHLQAAYEHIQRGLQAGTFSDLADDLILKVKSIFVYTLTMMQNPPEDPKPLYEELERFLMLDPELKNPEAIKIFTHYAKYIKHEYQKDKTQIQLIHAMLEKYERAQKSLIVNGRENSRLEREVTAFIEHLHNKITRSSSMANYSPGLFSPLQAPQLSPTGTNTFSLTSLSTSPTHQRPRA